LPCALVRQHGPFCWGRDVKAALTVAITLEEVAQLAALTAMIEPRLTALDSALQRKHFERKHGPQAYYGQP
jgi:L-ribulose-5-phosphate 4-epimerase